MQDISSAVDCIGNLAIVTPVIEAPVLSKMLGRRTVLKLENLQIGGSFKRRGVLNRLLSKPTESEGSQFVAVSGGNFGIALAEVCETLGLPVTIVLPQTAPIASANRIKDAGAKVIWTPDVSSAFAKADELASDGLTLIDDCDDVHIAAGSGTLALEFLQSVPEITDIVATIGGGSMISGVATAAKSMSPDIRVWGVETNGSDSMAQAMRQRKPVTIDVTTAISTLGVPQVSKVFLDIVLQLVREVIVVEDREAFKGVIDFAEKEHIWAEPAAGALIPAAKRISANLPENAVIGLVVCGGNTTVADVIGFPKR
ncbi:pyridoxal-phosphate dependent enzyme [Acuticoccus sp. MNP-M23]|uniref:pyridoxal-phosphate dependent enzyme n=1 Tax=Acuticoccus sp. MNP-M23 TaxID=3072793 RepID=UPI00281571AE|nr:pyridoxal-phosphate dependent enzyme [Acuticoccus sp. MNP-M23]WMS43173.1 pyridoxal-phosphate dependent enzyme [Acuticoccus sp. MNP-M23]